MEQESRVLEKGSHAFGRCRIEHIRAKGRRGIMISIEMGQRFSSDNYLDTALEMVMKKWQVDARPLVIAQHNYAFHYVSI